MGVQTELAKPGRVVTHHAMEALDVFVLAVFTIEIAVKVLAQALHPWRYFEDHWNK